MLKFKTNQKRWTQEEVEFLITNFEDMTYVEIAEKLDRTVKSVIQKVAYIRKKG